MADFVQKLARIDGFADPYSHPFTNIKMNLDTGKYHATLLISIFTRDGNGSKTFFFIKNNTFLSITKCKETKKLTVMRNDSRMGMSFATPASNRWKRLSLIQKQEMENTNVQRAKKTEICISNRFIDRVW